MKQKMMILVFLFLILCCSSSKTFVDIYVEEKLDPFTTQYYNTINEINKGSKPLSALNDYLLQIQNNLIGISIIEGLLKNISEDKNDKLIDLIREYIDKNELSKYAKSELLYLLEKRQNYKKYCNSNFSFSTFLYRISIFDEFSIILPNSDWKEVSLNEKSVDFKCKSFMAGDDLNAGTISLKIYSFKNFNLKDYSQSHGLSYYSDLSRNQMKYSLRSPLRQIGKSIIAGNRKCDVIYQQVQYSDSDKNTQEYVSTNRIFIIDKNVYEISIMNFISGRDIGMNIERMKNVQNMLLDSIHFN